MNDTPKLPPGQYESDDFPRFGLTPYAYRFPSDVESKAIAIAGDIDHPITISDAFAGLPRIEQVADFHCVTTWSRRSLTWGGVRFRDFHEQIVKPQTAPQEGANFVVLKAQDGNRMCLPLEDLLADDVLLADTLDGHALSIEHGAPLRLIAPAHYAYKSIKHLSRIEYWIDEKNFKLSGIVRFMLHPRGRVSREERGIGLPGWVFRFIYRPLVRPTAARFRRAMAAHLEPPDSSS